MRVLFIGGNHPRHLYFLEKVNEAFPIQGAIFLNREKMLPDIPAGLEDIDAANFVNHFKKREEAEEKYFGHSDIEIFKCERLFVTEETLNSQASIMFISRINPDVVLIFGSGLIKEPLLSALPKNTINLHLGLSPRYRGAATIFWAFYFLEPQFAGSTFHYIVPEPDSGDIIHQVIPKLEKGDSLHNVACKVVLESADQCVKLLHQLSEQGYWKRHKQKSSGKNFLERDFKAYHLRVIYNTFNDSIVDFFIESQALVNKPYLFNQFHL